VEDAFNRGLLLVTAGVLLVLLGSALGGLVELVLAVAGAALTIVGAVRTWRAYAASNDAP
jgi:hypothetical protein